MDDDSPIMAAVSAFYSKCYKDERVAHWFKGIPPEVQKRKLASFAYYAFGGEDCYAGRDLVEAHSGLVRRGLCDKDFDVIVELFVEALKEGNVPDELIAEIGALVEQTRDLVLGRIPKQNGATSSQGWDSERDRQDFGANAALVAVGSFVSKTK